MFKLKIAGIWFTMAQTYYWYLWPYHPNIAYVANDNNKVIIHPD